MPRNYMNKKVEYNLVDIHFHTKMSYDAYENIGYEKFDEASISEIISDNEKVSLLVMTDHNCFDSSQYIALKEQCNTKGITLLPGIEINNCKVHWIFIIDNEKLDADNYRIAHEISNEIYGIFGIDLTKEKIDQLKQSAHFSNIENAKKIISVLSKRNIEYMAIPHFEKSSGWFNLVKKDDEELSKIVNLVNDNVIFGFESSQHEEMFVSKIVETEQHLSKKISEYEIKLRNGVSPEDLELAKKEINKREEYIKFILRVESELNDVPQIFGSDFHGEKNLDDYKSEKKLLFFIKAENTFNGLRMSLLDKESRVFSHRRRERFSKSSNSAIIESIDLNIRGSRRKLFLGDGLNSIIGSRGSGKSYIIKSIIGKNSKYTDSKISSDITIEKINMLNGESFDSLNIEYISQKNDNNEDNHSLYNILVEAPYDIDKFIENISQFRIPASKSENDEIKEFVSLLNRQISLYMHVNQLKSEKFNYDFLQKYDNFIGGSGASYELRTKFESLGKKLDKKVDSNSSAITILEEYHNDLLEIRQKTKTVIDLKISNNENYENFLTELDMLLVFSMSNLSKVQEDLNGLNLVLPRIKNITKELSKQMTNEENNFVSNFSSFHNRIHQMKELLSESYNYQSEILSTTGIKRKTTIHKFDVGDKMFIVKLEEEVNFLNLSKQQREMLMPSYKSIPDKKEAIRMIFSDITGEHFRQAMQKDLRFTSGLLGGYEFVRLKGINSIFVGQEGELQDFIKMSPGQRSDILMDIVLSSNSDKVLVIDQPEDDLDNETVCAKILEKLRSIKLRRQVIAVTHNANICINGDSDVIIVCENDDNTFDLLADSMESRKQYDYHSLNSNMSGKTILELSVNILDGGREALSRRIRKFGYRKLFFGGKK